jgi:hypothetical protein
MWYFDSYQEASALGFASELEEETKSSGGFLEKLLTCFELGVTISSIEIELRTERYVRKSSKIMLSIGKIDARKLKQKSDSTIHSFSVSIGTLEGRFQQIGEHSAQKLFAFERLTRRGEPTMTTQALILAVDVLKAPGQESLRKTVVRGDLASLQCILTLLNSIDIFKVIDKLGLFALRKKYLDEGIGEILKFFKMHENEEAMMDVGRKSLNRRGRNGKRSI